MLDVGNTSVVVKTVQVVLDNGINWDDARICNFAVLPNTPLQTYHRARRNDDRVGRHPTGGQPGTTRRHPRPAAGQRARLLPTQRELSGHRVRQPTGAGSAGETNLVRNGDFVSGENSWTHWGELDVWAPDETLYTKLRAGGTSGSIFQDFSYSLPTGAPVELTVQLGNTGYASKTLDVTLHNPDWSDAIAVSSAWRRTRTSRPTRLRASRRRRGATSGWSWCQDRRTASRTCTWMT